MAFVMPWTRGCGGERCYDLTPIVAAGSGVALLMRVAVLLLANHRFDLRRPLATKS